MGIRMEDKEDRGIQSLICYGCIYLDCETGMCASHEGCIRADDKDIDQL